MTQEGEEARGAPSQQEQKEKKVRFISRQICLPINWLTRGSSRIRHQNEPILHFGNASPKGMTDAIARGVKEQSHPEPEAGGTVVMNAKVQSAMDAWTVQGLSHPVRTAV